MTPQVLDIGGGDGEYIRAMFQQQFLNPLRDGRTPNLPSSLISDDRGLKLWSEVTRAPEYYQTRDEIELFVAHGQDIAAKVPDGCSLIDLGSGDLRKVQPLLDHLEAAQKRVHYYSLDLSRAALQQGVSQFAERYQFIQCTGLWGSFDHGFTWVSKLSAGPKWLLSLGSILGNGPLEDAVRGLSRWASLMSPDDRLLLCMDAHTDPNKIWKSYHDPHGCYERFVRNGLHRSNKLLEYEWYAPDDWEMIGHLEPPMHQTLFRARRSVDAAPVGIQFSEGDLIAFHGAFKYPPEIMRTQFSMASLKELAVWKAPSSPIYDYLLSADSDCDSIKKHKLRLGGISE